MIYDNIKCANCSRLMNEEIARIKHNAKIDFWTFGLFSLCWGMLIGVIIKVIIGVMK